MKYCTKVEVVMNSANDAAAAADAKKLEQLLRTYAATLLGAQGITLVAIRVNLKPAVER